MRQRFNRVALIGVAVVATLLTGCGTSSGHAEAEGHAASTGSGAAAAHTSPSRGGFHGRVVDPPLTVPGGVFRDTNGRALRFAALRPNTLTVLFFGFTHCDDICPTTMADLALARRALSAATAERLSVVFITVDPARDRPAVLRRWLDRFDRDFIGVRATSQVLHQAERILYAARSGIAQPTSSKQPGAGGHTAPRKADYQVNHTGSVYAFGPNNMSLIYTGGTTPHQYAADFARLLRTKP